MIAEPPRFRLWQTARMRSGSMHKGLFVTAVLLLIPSSHPARVQDGPIGGVPAVFSTYSIIEATIEAPFAELIEKGRRRPDESVVGTLTLSDHKRETRFENVRITTRGHTSLRETECSFPKLKLDFTGSRVDGTVFDGVERLKIGTHCSDKPDGPGGKYGRWPNEKAAHREAFVYRLLETMNVPTLKARPARLTYVDTGERSRISEPIVREAMLLEDDSEAQERYHARDEL